MHNKRYELVKAAKDLYAQELMAGTSGNLSVCNHEFGLMLITPSGHAYNTMREDDLVLMECGGKIIEGKKPSSEWKMHAEIYKNNKNISAVVHTHSSYATAFAVCKEEIPAILIEMVYFLGGSVPVADFAMPGSVELAHSALKVLNGRNACLLSNHGTLCVGKDLKTAFDAAVYLEDAAKIYHLAKVAGTIKEIEKKYIDMMRNG